jgi:ABC-type phosphate transport system substrate-binding protein
MNRFFLLIALAFGFALPASAQVVVIAHPSSAAASLSDSDARNLFTLETARLGGDRVTPVVLENGVDGFYRWIGRDFSDLRKVWLRKKLSGEGNPPQTLASAAAVVAHVSSTPGAIGYVPAAAATGSVKVLARID